MRPIPRCRRRRRRRAEAWPGHDREEALTLSGFGGQGVLFAGMALAEGPCAKGWSHLDPFLWAGNARGTAHCHLRLSRQPIASPWISRPTSLIAFNQPSIGKFAHAIQPGGLLLANASMVKEVPDRKDIRIVRIPSYEIASELGSAKSTNMVMLGAYLELTGAVDQESILAAFVEKGTRPGMLESNRRAIEAGRRAAVEAEQA